jgi:ureidoacrylate peracid hydrolase
MRSEMHGIPTEAALRLWLAPRRTAVAIVDMQADFASPLGAVARAGADLRGVASALANAERLASAARRAGAPVIFVGLETTPDTDSPAWIERVRRLGGDPDLEMALCRRGSPGAAFYGPTPADGDLVIMKSRYSAFLGTDLLDRLRRRAIDTLVVCGVTTECCVDATVRDAFHADLHVFLVADACAGYDEALHDAALKSLALNFAILVETDRVEFVWSEP